MSDTPTPAPEDTPPSEAEQKAKGPPLSVADEEAMFRTARQAQLGETYKESPSWHLSEQINWLVANLPPVLQSKFLALSYSITEFTPEATADDPNVRVTGGLLCGDDAVSKRLHPAVMEHCARIAKDLTGKNYTTGDATVVNGRTYRDTPPDDTEQGGAEADYDG